MATTSKTRLTNLDTRGVAVVTSGANNKRFAFAKSKDGKMPDTIEKAFLAIIEKGDMPLDEAAVEDMCASAGCDPQMSETIKAIMKLRHVYRDNAAFLGVLKQLMAGAAQGEEEPAAPAAGQPAPVPGQMPGQEPAPQQQAQAQQPGQPGKPPFGGEKKEPPFGGEKKEPPFAPEKPGSDEGTNYPEGSPEGEEEPEMSDKDEAKKMADLVAKATADADKKAADAEKKASELEAVVKAQKEALDVNTSAVKKMQDDLRLSQWVAKAEKDLAFIPSKTAEELGKMLFDIDTLNPEMAKSQFELLKGQAAVVKSSGMFRPTGAAGASPAGAHNAYAQAEKLADEIVSKSDRKESPEMAKARALAAVFKADPALYKRYCDEQQSINRAAFN